MRGGMRDGRVLVVEDHEQVREMYGEILDRGDIAHCLTSGVGEALAALQDESFPVVILDARLGDASGYDVLAQIRDEPRHAATRVLLITGGGPDAETAPPGLVADEVLLKPVRANELLDHVRAALSDQ